MNTNAGTYCSLRPAMASVLSRSPRIPSRPITGMTATGGTNGLAGQQRAGHRALPGPGAVRRGPVLPDRAQLGDAVRVARVDDTGPDEVTSIARILRVPPCFFRCPSTSP